MLWLCSHWPWQIFKKVQLCGHEAHFYDRYSAFPKYHKPMMSQSTTVYQCDLWLKFIVVNIGDFRARTLEIVSGCPTYWRVRKQVQGNCRAKIRIQDSWLWNQFFPFTILMFLDFPQSSKASSQASLGTSLLYFDMLYGLVGRMIMLPGCLQAELNRAYPNPNPNSASMFTECWVLKAQNVVKRTQRMGLIHRRAHTVIHMEGLRTDQPWQRKGRKFG